MPSLRKLSQCFDCQYHDLSGYLVCALHPSGPSSDRCSDFVAMVFDRPSAIAYCSWSAITELSTNHYSFYTVPGVYGNAKDKIPTLKIQFSLVDLVVLQNGMSATS